MTAEFKKRPYEIRKTIANNNSEFAGETYSGFNRVRKGDGNNLADRNIQGTPTDTITGAEAAAEADT